MKYFPSYATEAFPLINPVSVIDLASSVGNSSNLLRFEDQPDDVPPGSHLISPRRFFIHHGIYLGSGRIAHYGGYRDSITPGAIEVTDLERFASSRPIWILQEPSEYSSEEIVSRARSRVGECHYSILSNNCEHFCNWCTRGKSYSVQVSALFRSPRRFFSMISALEFCFVA